MSSTSVIINLNTIKCGDNFPDPKVATLGQPGFDRLCYIVPNDVQYVFVLPPIKGNMLLFQKCRAFIEGQIKQDLRMKVKSIFLFAPPFYDYYTAYNKANMQPNIDLFHNVLDLKSKSMSSEILVLTEYTNGSVYTDCKVSFQNDDIPQKHLLTKMEVSYVIFPRTVQNTLDNKTFQGVIFSAAASDEPGLPDSLYPRADMSAMAASKNGLSGYISFMPNLKSADKLLQGNVYPYKTYRFFTNAVTSLDKLDIPETKVSVFSFQGINNTTDVTHLIATSADRKFTSRKDAYVSGVTLVSIPMGTRNYLLRHPLTQQVIDDWNNLYFTEDEADFLNDMKLRPDILEAIYDEKWGKNGSKEGWHKILSGNMATIVRSKCFNDNRLVLHSDCQQTQKFIADVMEYYMTHDARLDTIENNMDLAGDTEFRIKVEKKGTSNGNNVDPELWGRDPFVRISGNPAPLEEIANDTSIPFGIRYISATDCKNAQYAYKVIAYNNGPPDGKNKTRAGILSVDAGKITAHEAITQLKGKYQGMVYNYPRYAFYIPSNSFTV